MFHESLAVLLDYGIYLIPGLVLCGLWFALIPRTQPALRIVILLLAFVLMRDAMTPLGLWSLSSDLQIGFIANPWVLAVLGALSLGLVGMLARLTPELWQLLVVFKGNRIGGLAVGIAVGCLMGLPLRVYQGIEPAAIPGYWSWLIGMTVLAYGANALEEVLFRGFLQGYLEQHVTALRAALISAVAFSACHSFLALTVTQLGWPVLLFTLLEGLACALVRMRYGVMASTAVHGSAILLIAVPML
ncbi:CPBP family intramembrane glutamic endopeptidase [Pseudomonas gingeri]|uniref:CPBP family intramembrane metalloprotease n=1 Tax=Pseudomonas gingeri TaxID=117681 RepID=A0A7Y7YCS8_9PSED|nr:CPBP family intramembrane glutamic endopeptidase [Pseudomonas gingeri]NWA02294.1 CPBP family intramembrane metalloprotease [Pseudomonas gingeri]NWA12533.1 CPBP family intramembrane metalloprotease [Pseudomonas gingeri]NWA57061.1 CPBP family intramembrane metalloprotease [Pseudomonas gingeri]NWA93404.1 CPBP family intramembrane metalloprotease [Pseudomonas gingeri]NWB02876.1 CPBP family intramembrane metalloprotease [Pseudomonas gingeri]